MSQIIGGHRFAPLEKSIDDVKLNNVTDLATITPELISTQTQATTSATGDQYLILKSGAANLNRIAHDDLASSLAGGTGFQNQIWSTRLRSYNAVGNPNFEVDQRNVGFAIANAASGSFLCDRWTLQKAGTMAVTIQQVVPTPLVLIPGTNFQISRNCAKILLTTPQATLGASDYLVLRQAVEGPFFRELSSDVTSLSLLVMSDVAPLKFSIGIRSPDVTRGLFKLCTVNTTGSWQLIQLPNLAVWPSGGNFSTAPGVQGYDIVICVAAGSSYTAPAEGTWQNGNFVAAPGIDNWCSRPANTNFYIAFVQHEPGPLCSTLMDKPFSQNYDEALRYFQKTFSYPTKPGTVTGLGSVTFYCFASVNAYTPVRFIKPMATVPTVTIYNPNSGASGSARDYTANTDRAVSSIGNIGDSGYQGIATTTVNAANYLISWHHTADTGW